MSERDPSSFKKPRITAAAPLAPPPVPAKVTWGLAATILLSYGLQAFTLAPEGHNPLALSLGDGLGRGAVWQLLSYPIALPELGFSPFSRGLFALIETTLPLAIALGLAHRLERKLGSPRTGLLLLSLTLITGILALPVLALRPEMGAAVSGPLGLALGLLAFDLFHSGDEQLPGGIPTPLFFLLAASTLIFIAVIEFLPAWRDELRNPIALLPGVFVGGAAVLIDIAACRARQRRADQHEVDLIMEEVDARARVETLLAKISEHGMGALTRAERRFLEEASRFYRPESSRYTE